MERESIVTAVQNLSRSDCDGDYRQLLSVKIGYHNCVICLWVYVNWKSVPFSCYIDIAETEHHMNGTRNSSKLLLLPIFSSALFYKKIL